MNSNIGITLFNGSYGVDAATSLSKTNVGSIIFDQQSKSIYVDGARYGGGSSGLSDASFDDDVLKIWKNDDPIETPSIQIDFSSFETAKEVIGVFGDISDLITIETTAGTYIDPKHEDLVDADVLKSLNEDNVIETTDSVAVAVGKLDNKGKSITTELIKNELTTTRAFGAIQQSVGLDANMNIQFENPTIADESTVKGAIEKLAESSGAAWKDWD